MLNCVLNNRFCSLLVSLLEHPEMTIKYMKNGLKYYPTNESVIKGLSPEFIQGLPVMIATGVTAAILGKRAVSLVRQDFSNNKMAIVHCVVISSILTVASLYLMHRQLMMLFCQGAIAWGQAMDMGYIPQNVRNSPCGKLLGLN